MFRSRLQVRTGDRRAWRGPCHRDAAARTDRVVFPGSAGALAVATTQSFSLCGLDLQVLGERHSVGRPGLARGDEAIKDVLADQLRVALPWIAQSASAGESDRKRLVRREHHR